MSVITVVEPVITQESTVKSVVLKMPSIEEIRKRTTALIVKMISSNIFSLPLQKILKAWETNFYEHRLKGLGTHAERMKASLGLCFLLSKMIYPILAKCPQGSPTEKALQEFEEEFVGILKSTLPDGSNVDDFLEKYDLETAKRRLHLEKLNMISKFFDEQIKGLNALEESTQGQLLQFFETLKKKMIALNADRKSMTDAVAKKLDALTKKVNPIADKLQGDVADAGEMGQKLQSQQQRFLSILQECQNLLKEA